MEKLLSPLDIVDILRDPHFFTRLEERACDVSSTEEKEQNEAAAEILGQRRLARFATRSRQLGTSRRAKARLTRLVHDYIIKYFPSL